eukprot:1481336-Amphidinium_carterae.1
MSSSIVVLACVRTAAHSPPMTPQSSLIRTGGLLEKLSLSSANLALRNPAVFERPTHPTICVAVSRIGV